MAKRAQPALSAVEKLSASFDLTHFKSGKASLDEWLQKYALINQKSDSTQTYIVHRNHRIVGYYSLSASSIRTFDASNRAAAGQPKAGSIPVILLARLAVDAKEQGKGLGKALLKDALLRCEQAADSIGIRAVLVHALDQEAKTFYQKYGFETSPVEMTLMVLMKDIRNNVKSKD